MKNVAMFPSNAGLSENSVSCIGLDCAERPFNRQPPGWRFHVFIRHTHVGSGLGFTFSTSLDFNFI
jgi:hypothetical protein